MNKITNSLGADAMWLTFGNEVLHSSEVPTTDLSSSRKATKGCVPVLLQKANGVSIFRKILSD